MKYTLYEFKKMVKGADEVVLYHTEQNRYCLELMGTDVPLLIGRAHSMGSAKRYCESNGIPFRVELGVVMDEDDIHEH